MSREAMQMALEALEDYVEEYGPHEKDSGAAYAITALRQALETEQAMKDAIVGGTGVMLDGKRIDPATIYKQEPVAWANSSDLQNFDMKVRTGPDLNHTVPLYTAPPKKEWVELTKEDMLDCDNPMFDTDEFYAGMVWAEAKLKEKNS